MPVVIRNEMQVVRQLVAYAGELAMVEEAVRSLSIDMASPPTLCDVLERIELLRAQRAPNAT